MKYLLILAGSLLLLGACDPFMYYDNYLRTDGGEWKWSDIKHFEVDMTDSTGAYDIVLNFRHTTDYPKSNLFVFVTTKAPNGASRRDTVEVSIADDRGKWKGNGFGKIKLVSREYRRAVRVPYKGIYRFDIEQGMRIPAIPVTDVGLRVEEYRKLD